MGIFCIVMVVLFIGWGVHWLDEYANDGEIWEIALSLFNFGWAIFWIAKIFN